jgi:hypothetical protein
MLHGIPSIRAEYADAILWKFNKIRQALTMLIQSNIDHSIEKIIQGPTK